MRKQWNHQAAYTVHSYINKYKKIESLARPSILIGQIIWKYYLKIRHTTSLTRHSKLKSCIAIELDESNEEKMQLLEYHIAIMIEIRMRLYVFIYCS